MPRYCFTGQVQPNRLDEYRRRHAAVWPELLHALKEAGWHKYSLFLRDDGLLVGYVEADDLAAAQAAIEATEVNARWQAAMSDLFTGLDGGGAPDQNWQHLDEVFDLDDQLATGISTDGTDR